MTGSTHVVAPLKRLDYREHSLEVESENLIRGATSSTILRDHITHVVALKPSRDEIRETLWVLE